MRGYIKESNKLQWLKSKSQFKFKLKLKLKPKLKSKSKSKSKSKLGLEWLLLGLISLTIASCSTPRPDPTPLEPFQSQRQITTVWQTEVGIAASHMRPLVWQQQVIAVSEKGKITNLDGVTGRIQWQMEVGQALTTGAGFDGERVAVVTRDQQLVVLSGQSILWRIALPTSVFTAPLVAGQRVFVLGADRTLTAFDALTGQRLWQLSRASEALVLQQAGILLAYQNQLIVGLGPKWLAVQPDTGQVVWETNQSMIRGLNEVERLADLVWPAHRLDHLACGRTYRVSVGCIDLKKGQMLWSQPASGDVGLAGTADALYGVESMGRLRAWRRDNGQELWSVDRMLYRYLGTPVVWQDHLVVGDDEMGLHVLSRSKGDDVARLFTDGSGVVGVPVAMGALLVAQTKAGVVWAWKLD